MADIQHIYNGMGTPNFTPLDIGLHYIDTTTDDAYISVDTIDFNSWIKLGSSDGVNEYWFDVASSGPNLVDIPLDADIVHIQRTSVNVWKNYIQINLPLTADRVKHRVVIHIYGVIEGDISPSDIVQRTEFRPAFGDFVFNRNGDFPGEYKDSPITDWEKAVNVYSLLADTNNSTWIIDSMVSIGLINVTYGV